MITKIPTPSGFSEIVVTALSSFEKRISIAFISRIKSKINGSPNLSYQNLSIAEYRIGSPVRLTYVSISFIFSYISTCS